MIDQEINNSDPPTPLRHRLSGMWARIRKFSQFAAGIGVALLALVIFNALTPEPDLLTEGDVRDTILQVMASATPAPAFSAQVYQVIQPSLVLIQTRAEGEHGEEEDGLGSGVVINDKGDILTSLHVVDSAAEIRITYADGTRATGEVIADDVDNDIAVLSSDSLPEMLVPAVLGNPHVMRVGDEAYVVGNPFGLYSSVSAGVISGFERTFQPEEGNRVLENLIQVDAAVNPGNSGGPLLNRYGQVIGIVVGIINPTENDFFIGIGFAVPIDIAGGIAGIPPY